MTAAVFNGILDSLRGFALIFTLDRQIELQRSRMKENKSKSARRSQLSATAPKEKHEFGFGLLNYKSDILLFIVIFIFHQGAKNTPPDTAMQHAQWRGLLLVHFCFQWCCFAPHWGLVDIWLQFWWTAQCRQVGLVMDLTCFVCHLLGTLDSTSLCT